MPLGLWKSKWEIHREDMVRHREESERRSAEHRTEMDRYREETAELREKYDRELAETRRFNREMLVRLEKTYASLGTTLGLMSDEIIAMRGEIHELKGAVDAQTEAIVKWVDRFEEPDGRPPV
jgi:predicted nuclease with TOPRIM domain